MNRQDLKQENLLEIVEEYELSCEQTKITRNKEKASIQQDLEKLATQAIVPLDPNRTVKIYPLIGKRQRIFPAVYDTPILLWTQQYYKNQKLPKQKQIKLPQITYIIPIQPGEYGYKTSNGNWVNGIYTWPPEYFLCIKNPSTRQWIKHQYENVTKTVSR